MLTLKDLLTSDFLERAASVSALDMILVMALSFAAGLFIFFIYKKTYAGVMYSASFGVTLIALAMITALLILAVTSNVILSLGMVGALSIVRFRTAIKEPSDIAFLFWAIAVGIVLAAGFIPLAVFGSLLIGIMLLVFSQHKPHQAPFILVLHCDSALTEQETHGFLTERAARVSLKSKSVAPGCIELNYEIRLKDADTSFVNRLAELPGVTHAVLVSYNGDYMS